MLGELQSAAFGFVFFLWAAPPTDRQSIKMVNKRTAENASKYISVKGHHNSPTRNLTTPLVCLLFVCYLLFKLLVCLFLKMNLFASEFDDDSRY